MDIRKHLTNRAARAMEFAQRAAEQLEADYIGTEHFLLGLTHEKGSVAAVVLASADITFERVLEAVRTMQDHSPVYPSDNPYYTPRAKRVLEGAVEEAQTLHADFIGTEHILLALLSETEGAATEILESLGSDFEELTNEVLASIDAPHPEDDATQREERQSARKGQRSKGLLGKFGRDLTDMAREGRMDPVIGRDKEITRVIQILARRTKNNPVFLGEPGVGKTAIAEGLAGRIAEGTVPYMLQGKRVISLSLASLVAGAKYRGEFEERMMGIIEEATRSRDVILFIDELHTLIGAGAGEGALDAANILKPALARGELQIIGATTLEEYKKYLEKDTALSRRFQTILVEEPTEETAREILRGLRGKYEEFHRAQFEEEALDAAVRLSKRYITDRFLPDKAIDLMDEAASKVRMKRVAQPEKLRSLREALHAIQSKKDEAIGAQEFERAAGLRDEEQRTKEELRQAEEAWEKRGESRIKVSSEDIADVVAQWTGIPVRQIVAKESQRLLHLEQVLGRRVIGQEEGVKAVSKAIRRARAGLKDPKRPIGSFLFLGPTGVGKTELAKTLASVIFGSEDAIIRFDMSEYMEKHTVSRMVGAPPGYVGYEEGGQLTDAVRKKPYSIVLLDEIEKAHPDVFHLLLQVLDDGRLTDGKGRTVDFRNTVIIMTSNAGANLLRKEKSTMGFSVSEDEEKSERQDAKKRVLGEVRRLFKPEFLNRIDEMVVFDPLGRKELGKIVDILLGDVRERLSEKGLHLEVTPAAKDTLVARGTDFKYGARPLKRAIQNSIEDELADRLLAKAFVEGDTIQVRKVDGKLDFVKKDKAEKAKERTKEAEVHA